MFIETRIDQSTFGSLLEEFRRYLLLITRRQLQQNLSPRLDAEDLVQATLLRASRSFDSFSGHNRKQLFQWLITIHRNTLIEEQSWQHAKRRDPGRERSWQARQASPAVYWLEPADGQPTPSVRMMRHEESLRLVAALRRMNPDQSTAVRLRHLEGLSTDQIAKQMGRSSQAIAGLIKRLAA
jgi:RNA polymerase sigma-70 factor (ECF subfamily)